MSQFASGGSGQGDVTAQGAAGGKSLRRGKFVSSKAPSAVTWHLLPQLREALAQAQAWGREVCRVGQEASICQVEWQHSAIQNKRAAVQHIAAYSPASNTHAGLIYPYLP